MVGKTRTSSNARNSRLGRRAGWDCRGLRAFYPCHRAAVFCDPAGERGPWGWLRHCPVTKNEQKVERGVCVLVECGSLREVHLLLTGVLQTRHQVTVARYAIRDPLPVRLLGPPLILKSFVHADSCQSVRWRLLLSIALPTSYFNTLPSRCHLSPPSPPIPTLLHLYFIHPPPRRKDKNRLSKKAQPEHGSRPLSALS